MTPLPASMPLWLRLKLQKPSADDLLRKFGIATPPIPVEKIAQGLGVAVRFVPGLPCSGMVQSSDTSATISVRVGEVPWRQRFTIAHELGHLMLHKLGEEFRDTDTFSGDQREWQANNYAADLLMPLWLVEQYALKFGADSSRIASIFGVSAEAMNITLGKMVGRR
jgi:hypothetical protein